MRIRLKFPFRGAFHNHDSVRVGDVVEVDDIDAIGYIKAGYAEAVKEDDPPVETAVAPKRPRKS